MHIIEIDGARFALGLWWQSTGSQEDNSGATKRRKNLRSQAQGFARDFENHEYDVWVPLSPESEMVALGRSDGGLGKRGVHSLAATMATAGVNSFVGLFALDGGYWACAIFNGRVLPDGDFYGDRRDAEGMLDHLRAFDLQFDESKVCETEEESYEFLSRYVAAASGMPRLQPLRSKGPNRVLLVALVAILAFGTFEFWNARQQAELERQQAALAEQQRLLAERSKKPLGPVTREQLDATFGKPWEAAPRPSAVARACSILLELPLYDNGWALKDAECDGKDVHLRWQFDPQSSTFTKLPFPEFTSLDTTTPTVAHTRFAVDLPAQPRGAETLRGVGKARQHYYEISRRVRAAGTQFSWAERASAVIGEGEAQRTVQSPYQQASWQHGQVLLYPGEASAYMDLLPGLVLARISFNGANWKTEGTIYAEAQ
jgi:hypothetical protein